MATALVPLVPLPRLGLALGAVLTLLLLALSGGCTSEAVDAVAGARGPSGAIGDACVCANGQADCDGDQAGCQAGLDCVRGDVTSSRNTCTKACPCPLGFVCRAAGVPGARLSCFRTP